MAKHTLEELRSEYNSLLQTCEIRADKLTEVQDICDTVLANKPRYEAIATATSVPWFMVAAIHSLEGSLNFKTHLHNGDPLTARTVNEPAGRPKNGSPPFTFEESAIDALAFDKVAVNLEPTFAGICFKLEGFNGFRSRELGIHTPYLWSFSNHYTKGKFVRDGVFDPDAVSKQCGSAVILLRLLEMKAINRKQLSLGRVLKQSLQKAPKTKHEHQTMSLDTTIRAVQKELGVTVDGQPGPETWRAIHLSVVRKNPAPSANLDTIIRTVQKKLGVFEDGNAGPETWAAIHLAVVGKKARGIKKGKDTTSLVGEGKPADSRSEKNIATLLPRVRPFARALIEKVANQGIIIKVTSGTRSFAEQDELFAKGRTTPPIGKKFIVTNARGGFSNHNFGIAFDVTIFEGSTDPEKAKTPVFESPVYKAIGALGTELGLEWGGNWKTLTDEPHFQLRPGWAADLREPEMLAQLRERKDSGKDFFA
jgi:peptidoglycan LD-endopeptidase CwlK